jgi:hypothetical protein
MDTNEKHPRWKRVRFILARAGWVLLALLVAVGHVVIADASYRTLVQPGADLPLHELGLPVRAAAVLSIMINAASGVVCLGLAGLLFGRLVRRGEKHDYMTIFTAYMLLTFSPVLNYNYSDLKAYYPIWDDVLALVGFTGASMFLLFLLRFPTGKYVPRFSVWLPRLALVWIALWFVFPAISPNSLPDSITNLIVAGFLCLATATQVYRFIKVSNPVERQQTKWVAYSLFVLITIELISTVGDYLFPTWNPVVGIPAAEVITQFISNFMWLLFPASLVIAMLRYHLWEIDRLINKTIVYSLLTLILATVYFGSVMLLQSLLAPSVSLAAGGPSTPAVVISTLGVAALFSPLRTALQRWIDRRFYRSRYSAGRILTEFGEFARTEVSLENLAGRLTDVVEETLQPEHVSLWLIDHQPRSKEAEEAWKMLLEV